MTSTPVTSAASSAFSAGTITRRCPDLEAASTAGSTPATGRTRPSSPSSPRCTTPAADAASTSPAAARHATAIARSNAEPCLGSDAGERFTVTRRCGSGQPALVAADRTRSRPCESAASGSPTMTNAGS
jgi:hypothetical protein